MVRSKELCAFLYEDHGLGSYVCKECGTPRKQQMGSGYSNLMSHITTKHPMYEAMDDAGTTGVGLESFGFVSQKTNNRFQWLQWVVERNVFDHGGGQPDHARYKQVAAHLFQDPEEEHVATSVGTAIDREMGTTFGLMFDGWTHGFTHCVGLYGVYEVMGARYERLLSLSPLEEGSQPADAHIDMIKSVLGPYNKTTKLVAFLVGDNCSTNRKIATVLGVPLVGCASHRFNLAVNQFLAKYESELAELNSLMTQLHQVNNAAVLSKFTDLVPIKRNTTRWGSTYSMCGPQKLVALLAELQKRNTVCSAPQYERTTVADVRLLFDNVLEDYLMMAEHLSASAKIVHSPLLESALVKLGNSDTLTAAEARAGKCFEVTVDSVGSKAGGQPANKKRKKPQCDYAGSILQDGKKRRVSTRTGTRYTALSKLVPPTSNTAERLFSMCKLTMTPQRSCILPANFEILHVAFLRVNRDMWNASSLVDSEE